MTSLALRTAWPWWKRVFDLAILLLAFLPSLLMAAAIFLWIKLVSRGPVIFCQERIGQRGAAIIIYKFRTMTADAETDSHRNHVRDLVKSGRPLTKLDAMRDPRLIPGGRFLRSTGIDELPQLVNVLRGELSLVGPRPCLPEESEFLSPSQRERLDVVPGLTGYWQVEGKNRTTFNEMVALDIHYVRNRSLALDTLILLRTPAVLVRQWLIPRDVRPIGDHRIERPGPRRRRPGRTHRSSA